MRVGGFECKRLVRFSLQHALRLERAPRCHAPEDMLVRNLPPWTIDSYISICLRGISAVSPKNARVIEWNTFGVQVMWSGDPGWRSAAEPHYLPWATVFNRFAVEGRQQFSTQFKQLV